jgi:hypothetical protein
MPQIAPAMHVLNDENIDAMRFAMIVSKGPAQSACVHNTRGAGNVWMIGFCARAKRGSSTKLVHSGSLFPLRIIFLAL